MIHKIVISLILSMTLLLNACVTAYKGPGPNFSLKGKEAEAEINRFRLEESFWHQRGRAFEMGDDHQPYWDKSLRPIMEDVSPESVKKLEHSYALNNGVWISLIVAVGSLVAAHNSKDSQTENLFRNLTWVGIAGELGFGISSLLVHGKAAEQFNKDLKNKFTPTVSLKTNF